MRFCETPLAGAFVIELERREDERGFFARSWCEEEFAAHGITAQWVQSNISFNHRAGTLRGMHYQESPYQEAKLVRCTAGAAYDVIIDLRPGSPTHGRWNAVVLSAANHTMLYVPKGFAQGFQTLEDNTEMLYLMSEVYRPEWGHGLRWDDPALAIAWPPCRERIISPRDQSFPLLHPFSFSNCNPKEGPPDGDKDGVPHGGTVPGLRQRRAA
jgi:dTDP-4-dehydrorhamnose 3,5-epimerase